MPPLPPLPPQPDDVPFPAADWPEARLAPDVDGDAIEAAAARAFTPEPSDSHGETLAWAIVHRGRLVFERHAVGKGPDDTFISWSMAKSLLHALVGVLVGEGRLDPAAPAPVPAWRAEGDPRRAITLEHLLRQTDGLDFEEVYADGIRSDVVDMLFRSGKDDVAAFAEARPLAHEPGTLWNYSSGTSNVVSAIVGRTVGSGEADTRAFLHKALFDPIGMRSATARFDAAGTFIGSSYVFATARDFARFGLLYLRDGVWDGRRLLPEGWVDHARTITPPSRGEYGAHWWIALHDPGIFNASGFQGQYIVVVPDRDLVLVRLGVSAPEQRVNVVGDLRRVVEAFPRLDGARS
ncbi:MAG TPA: serine hydrolase [Myxococcota bacterium]|nr:serine hydrolase [Myxococcota bacterium]